MTEPDDVIAYLYEIGGRRDTRDARPVRRDEHDDLTDRDGPIPESEAREQYRSRVRGRAANKGR